MNIWKISTIALAMAVTAILSRDAFTKAAASPAPQGDQGIHWEWEREQPRMEQALRDLRGARHSLELASEHKGGWRALALRHTDEAIAETERGMEWGHNHPRE